MQKSKKNANIKNSQNMNNKELNTKRKEFIKKFEEFTNEEYKTLSIQLLSISAQIRLYIQKIIESIESSKDNDNHSSA